MGVTESREEARIDMGDMVDDGVDANKVVFGDGEGGGSGSDETEVKVEQAAVAAVQPLAPVEGTVAEVGEFAIVHYGSDVYLGEIIEVDREENKCGVVFFKSFRAWETYTFRYEKGKATSWVLEGGINNIVRPPLPISKGCLCLANDDLDRYKCIRADVNPGGC